MAAISADINLNASDGERDSPSPLQREDPERTEWTLEMVGYLIGAACGHCGASRARSACHDSYQSRREGGRARLSDSDSLIGLDRVSNIKKKRGDRKVAAAAAFKEGGSDRLLTVVKTTPCTRTRDCLLSHSSSCLPLLIPLPPLPLPSFCSHSSMSIFLLPLVPSSVRRHLLQQRGRSLTRSPLSRLSSRRFLCRRSAVAQTATAAAEGATRTSPEALFLPLPPPPMLV